MASCCSTQGRRQRQRCQWWRLRWWQVRRRISTIFDTTKNLRLGGSWARVFDGEVQLCAESRKVTREIWETHLKKSNSKLFLSKKSFGKQLMFWCWIEELWWCCNAGEKRRKRRWCSISTPGQRRKDVLSFLSSRFATFLLSRIILKWRKNHCKISILQAMVVRGVKPALVTLYDYYDKNEKWVFDIF